VTNKIISVRIQADVDVSVCLC